MRFKRCSIIAASFVLLLGFSARGQKPFEGKITYEVTYKDLPAGQSGKKDALPSELYAFIKGKNLRVQQYTALAGEWTTIQPARLDSTFHCFYLLDQRVMLVRKQERKAAYFRVVEWEGERTWESFNLSQVRLQKADGGALTAWVDERYINPFQTELPELRYLPLEFEIERGGVTVHHKATEAQHTFLDDTYFDPPENATRIDDRVLLKLLQ